MSLAEPEANIVTSKNSLSQVNHSVQSWEVTNIRQSTAATLLATRQYEDIWDLVMETEILSDFILGRMDDNEDKGQSV